MFKLLQTISKNLVISIPVTIVLGFLYGIFINPAPLKAGIIPFTFLMIYPMMITLKFKKVLEGGDFKAQFIAQFLNFLIIPFVAFFIGKVFFKDYPYLALGILLTALVPTSGMTISWTGFAKGNLELAVKMTVFGLTFGSLATPFYVKFLMGRSIEIDLINVFKQILVIVFIPMVAGYLTQEYLIKKYGQKTFQEKWAGKIPLFSTIGVLGIVFIAIALKAKSILNAPGLFFIILIPLSILYALNYIISTILGKWFLKKGDAIALVFGTVMRNLSIVLAIAVNAFKEAGQESALVIAVAYIIQVQSAAWYVKLREKIFG